MCWTCVTQSVPYVGGAAAILAVRAMRPARGPGGRGSLEATEPPALEPFEDQPEVSGTTART